MCIRDRGITGHEFCLLPAALAFPNLRLTLPNYRRGIFILLSLIHISEVQEDNELNGDYDFYRPIIRLENYD